MLRGHLVLQYHTLKLFERMENTSRHFTCDMSLDIRMQVLQAP